MKILAADFITSATEPSQFPPADLPEFAFAGRSNVGKSSLMNMLLGRKGLARVSQTPGRTRLINFFKAQIGTGGEGKRSELSLVDLPGYGYAKVAKTVKDQWGPMIESYLNHRPSLRALVVLTDVRRGEDEERDLVEWAGRLGIAVVAVATKIDKLSRGQRTDAVKMLETFLGVPVIGCSATTGEGRDELWKTLMASARSRRKAGG